ncbi:MAG: ABC transporter ATP-binding protein [Candidatus Omnitrophica bacterium]|nr:ABC transporter ATP-binding protein [Candidatus Omnitrophota bacterium]MDD5352427.1 ABC transporter ATP-binding protein [Candidatus Omnitrophota bacterium]MDD5550025.1 ABC transporter ATP-binding protein [Candidatus Omnitrophota bacterium]
MSNIAIKVENISKQYRIGTLKARYSTFRDTLSDAFKTPFRKAAELLRGQAYAASGLTKTKWALKNLSLEVRHGEAVGIIGHNGAGKTTLLKILSRITEPTTGFGDIYGRVGSLLEVGTGFHPELTGRDNIYLNGAILGMKRLEITRKFDEIVDFAGVEEFIDTPVKFYSSGMHMRLAFAVAAHLETEILLVDEVLAVGDVAFQKKCLNKMSSVTHQGRTVLLVSHNMEAIMGLCSRAIWLHQGEKEDEGPSQQIVKRYLSSYVERGVWQVPIAERTDRVGAGSIRFTGFRLQDKDGNPIDCIVAGETVDFVFSYVCKDETVGNVTVWFWIRDDLGRDLLCLWSRKTGQDFEKLPKKGELICRIPRFPLRPNKYIIDLKADVNNVHGDRLPDAALFEVVAGDFYGTGRSVSDLGIFLCDHSWRYSENSSSPNKENK